MKAAPTTPSLLGCHLRYQILPGKNVRHDTVALADFCRQHGIEEVVLFFAAEE